MRRRCCKGAAIWLLVLAVFFALYFSLRRSRAAMTALCGVLLPLERWMGRCWSLAPFSAAEVLTVALVCAAILYAMLTLRRLLAGPERGRALCRFCLTALCAVLTVYAGFCLLWGPFYNTAGFQERAGLTARGGTAAELTDVTALFARTLADTADQVRRDEDGCFAEDRQALLERAESVYEGLCEAYPFLRMNCAAPKGFTASRALSMLQFTGFYFPFTGEANVNTDSPAAWLPAVACHEMSHQRGISSEQECNFLGIQAAVQAEDPAYRYSGALMGYVYLSNALYRVDRAAWQRIRDTLPDTVLADLRQNNDYWALYRGTVQRAADKVYDGFLKSNGDALGIRSYGTVVDLLIAYYA